MNEREMLELAAKAASIVGFWVDAGINTSSDAAPVIWNPRTDDGDALRLMVAKRFTIKDFAPCDNPEIAQAPADAALWGMVEIWRQDDEDPLHVEWYKAGADREDATRRAITRAAAEIGKAMP